MSYPTELLYTKDHEWVRVEGEVGTVGITDYAQKELGDIVFVELPRPGDAVTAGESFGTLESVKAVSDVFAPVTGTVEAVNAKLQDQPEMVNADPHGQGWLMRVRLANRAETEKLMLADTYETYLQEAKAP